MKNLILIFLLSFTITSSYGASKIENNESEDTTLIKIYTTQGEIELKLFDDKPLKQQRTLFYMQKQENIMGLYFTEL